MHNPCGLYRIEPKAVYLSRFISLLPDVSALKETFCLRAVLYDRPQQAAPCYTRASLDGAVIWHHHAEVGHHTLALIHDLHVYPVVLHAGATSLGNKKRIRRLMGAA
jgi:hypothetical protein